MNGIDRTGAAGAAGVPAASSGPRGAEKGSDFTDALADALGSVNRDQNSADAATRIWAAGGGEQDLHTVLLQVEKADLSFRTMMEVRNRLLDAYREVMRMSI